MISLSQVKELESRVGKVIDTLRVQNAENASLRERIAGLEARLDELGSEISSRMADEEEIEAGLQGVIDMLDRVDSPNEAEPGNDSAPIADEIDSESPSGNSLDAQIGDDEHDSNMSNEKMLHSDNSESEDANSSDDRFQSEFDIF